MTSTSPPQTPRRRRPDKATETREDRLKAALKANLARRKAQARARAEDDDDKETTEKD